MDITVKEKPSEPVNLKITLDAKPYEPHAPDRSFTCKVTYNRKSYTLECRLERSTGEWHVTCAGVTYRRTATGVVYREDSRTSPLLEMVASRVTALDEIMTTLSFPQRAGV